MKVEHILQSKGADVFAVSDATTVKDAVDMLGEKNIGAVIVKDGGGAVSGIFSERDVVRRLKKDGPGVLSRPVAECMTRNPITCTPETSVDELMGVMTSKRIRHVPVVAGDMLVGMVSIGDLNTAKEAVMEETIRMLEIYSYRP